MDKRIAQLLDDVAVEFGVFALEDELDVFALLHAKVADEPRHFLERVSDRYHAERHRRPLQVGGDPAKLSEAARQMDAGNVPHLGTLHHHRLRDDQFADEVDEAVEFERVHADDAGCGRPRLMVDLLSFSRLGSVADDRTSLGLRVRRRGRWRRYLVQRSRLSWLSGSRCRSNGSRGRGCHGGRA